MTVFKMANPVVLPEFIAQGLPPVDMELANILEKMRETYRRRMMEALCVPSEIVQGEPRSSSYGTNCTTENILRARGI